MKKVLKKFNRTLSIMLAAAMVLTMVPQTAMPVLAAEEEQIEATAEVAPEVEESEETTETTEPAEESEGSADVGETGDTTETTPDDEQENEDEGETEIPSGDNETPVTDPAEEPVEDPDEEQDPVEEEIVDPTIDPEETEEEPSDVESVTDSEINAVVDTDSVITVEYANDPTTDTATNTAEVIFLGGCVSSENKLAEGRDLRFKVEPAAGRVLVKVEHQIGDAASATAISVGDAGVYSVGKASFVSGENALSGKIIVTTKAANYKVSFDGDGSVAGSYKIYPVEAKSESDATEVLGAEITGSAKTDVAYGKTAKFALVLTAEDDVVANKLDSITLNGEDITVTPAELNVKGEEASAAKTKCLTFTVDPSKAGNLGDTTEADTEAVVSVKVVAKAKLTVAFDDANANSSVAASATNTGDTFINYSGTNFGTDSTFVEDDATSLAKSLAFKVTPVANYKITDVTAKATSASNQDGTAVTVTKPAAAADGSIECTIALSGVGSFSEDTDLTISIATALDDAKDAVHTINFRNTAGSAPEHVTIMHGESSADDELEDSSLTVAADNYTIKVAPETGYDLAKGTKTEGDGKNDDKFVVTLKEKRVYTVNDAPVEKEISTEVEAYDSAAKAITLKLKDAVGDKLYKDNATDEDAAAPYVVKSVDVVIDTTVQKNDGEKIVHFTDNLGAGYEITADGVIHDEEAAEEEAIKDTWVVPATVDVLTFTVTSARVPAVTVDSASYDGSAAENVYTFAVPAMALSNVATTEIAINAKDALANKSVKVKVVADDVTVKSVYNKATTTENLSGAADGYYTLSVTPKEGSDFGLIFEPKPGVTIDKVSYTMGETTGEATPDREGNYTLDLTVTDDVTVDVESKSDYRVKLSNASGELESDGDAYVADYTDTNIDIELTKAGVTYSGNLYDVVVKDGTKTAATEATVAGAKATIAAIDKTEYGKDLTIEVYTNKSTKYTTTLKTNAVSDEVAVTRVVNGKATKVAEDATIEIMPDAEMAFAVTPAKGASLTDLNVEILAKDGTALTAENTPVETFDFADGTLTVQTKPGAAKDTEVLVSIFNKNAKTADNKEDKTSLKGGKFVLKLTDPLVKSAEISKVNAVAGSGTNRAVRLNVSVDFKNKKSLPAAPLQGDLYYKVELDAPTGAPASVTVISGAALVQYVKVEDFANPNTTLTIPVVVSNTEDVNGVEADIAEIISTKVKVTLVQSLKKTPAADADYVAGPEAAMKDNTLSTKAPVYETKLSVKTVNGATVTTGQTDVKVATPVFGKTTAYDNIRVQFVDTKTGVSYGNSFAGFTTNVDSADNSVLVSASKSIRVNGSSNAGSSGKSYKDLLKTLGVKVTAVAPDESYAASAVVKLKVKQGIYKIDVDESKARLPKTLYKENSKKTASVTIKPLLNEGYKDCKPAKSTLTWKITDSNGETEDLSPYMKSAISGAKPLVSVKNGKVTVAAGYQIQPREDDNKFYVTIQAADFADNTEKYIVGSFEITDQKNEIGKVVILDNDGNVKDPATLTAEDFDYWDHSLNDGSDDTSKYLYAVALKKGVKDADRYTDPEDILPVTFKSSSAKALAVDTASGLLTFYKPADKIKITATTVDGGKATKLETLVNVKPYKQVGLSIVGVDSRSGLDETDIHYSGGNNESYTLYPHYAVGDGWKGISDYKNLKITVKGGKFIANKDWAKFRGNRMGYAVVVTDKSGKATITVTDTANKDKANNHKDYTITNDSFSAVKAPSIKLYDPKKVAADTEEITWQVTDKDNDNYAGSYVKLTPDFTVTASNPAYGLVGEKGKILKINENGRFTLVPRDLYGGAYKMVATVGTMAGGEFVASTKDVKLNFSIPVRKYKTNLTVTGAYKLDAKSATTAEIIVKSDYAYTVSEAMNVVKKEQGKNDHTNHFTDYFEVLPIEYRGDILGYTVGLKPGLTAEQIAYITSKDAKDDCVGYITVSNGYGTMENLGQKLNTKDVQIKISFKENKYSLSGAAVFSNGTTNQPVNATVQLMNGKLHDYAAMVAIDATDDGAFAKSVNFVNDTENPANPDNGDIIITSGTTEVAAGKYTVKLIVIPQDSSYVTWDDVNKKWIPANDKLVDGKPLTDAELIAKAGIPVTAKIDVKAVDTAKAAGVKNLKVTLTAKDYVQKDNAGAYVGKYVVDVPYTMIATGSDIASVAVKLTDAAGADLNEVGASKDKLVTTEKLTVTDEKGNDVNVIRLSVSKKALNLLNDEVTANRAAKVVTNYGKTLKVPVVVKYTNGITTEDTLNFNVVMPKTRPMDFAAVKTMLDENKAAIEKIQTRLLGNAENVLRDLLVLVSGKVESLIPADTDVAVSYTLSKKYLNDGEELASGTEGEDPDYGAIMSAGNAKVTLTLTDVSKAAENTADVSWKYTLGMNAASNDISAAVAAIEALSLNYTNETTAATLLADIKADDTVKPYLDARKGHLSLKVSHFEKSYATTRKDGRIAAEITVKDLVTGNSDTTELIGIITQLGTLTEAKKAVGALFDDAAEVLTYVDDCSGQEAIIKEAILKAAKDAAGNKDIAITFKADTATVKGWDYKAPTAAVTDAEGNETAAAADGSLKFTLVLTKPQADGSRSVEITSAAATIDASKVEKYVSLANVKTKISAEVTGDKLKALVDTAATANDADAIKTEIGNKLNTEIAKYLGYSWAWAQKADKTEDFTYTEATQLGKGKLSFQIVLTLDGAKEAGLTTGVTETISVTDAEVVDPDDAYQTAEELKVKIEAIGTAAAPIKAATLPADLDAAKTALEAEIAKVNKATPAITVAVENVAEAEGVTATTYTKTPETEPTKGEYKNVKITIGTGEAAIVFSHDFNFAVTPAEGA